MKKISSLDSQISSLDFQTLGNKIDTIEWKVDSSSDPSFWKESNDNLSETENKHIETEPIKERKGVKVIDIDSILLSAAAAVRLVYVGVSFPSMDPRIDRRIFRSPNVQN